MSATVRSALAAATACLGEAGVEAGARDARALMAAALGISADRITLRLEECPPRAHLRRFDTFIEQRLAHMPVSRILARRLFWGREFIVSPHVLDPRPETEVLIAAALGEGPCRRILDLGTGSGVIGVTLLAEWKDAVAVATDISAEALEVADANAARAGVGQRMEKLRSDWYERVAGGFDLVVSNPPYVTLDEFGKLPPEVRLHDPVVSLTDGGDGLSAFRLITAGLTHHLKPGGRVLVELGPAQAAAVSDMFAGAGLDRIVVHQDLDGRDRVVGARMTA